MLVHSDFWPFLCRHSCCCNSSPFLAVLGHPDIWTFGLSCSVQKYVIQNCEWFTLKTQMVLAGSFFLLPNNTQSKSPYMTVIFFVSASKRTKQHISSASFDRFLGQSAQCTGQKGTAISELHWIYERKLKDKSRQNGILFPSENPLSNDRNTWVSHKKNLWFKIKSILFRSFKL